MREQSHKTIWQHDPGVVAWTAMGETSVASDETGCWSPSRWRSPPSPSAWAPSGRPAAAASESPAAGGATLRIGWTADPDNLSPFTGVETATAEVLYLTYDRLFGFGLDGKPIPQLATELPTQENGGISADGLTWTVHIRPGVKWQDGEPLTAADVAFTLQPDHRQQADLVPAGGQGHQARRGGRRHHRALHHVGAQGGHALRGRVRPPGAHLGQGQAVRRSSAAPPTRRRSSAAGPSR